MKVMGSNKDKYSDPVAALFRGVAVRAAEWQPWAAAYTLCVRPSLLQSPLYGRTLPRAQPLLITVDGMIAGTALAARGGGPLWGMAALDEGPCWHPGFGTINHNAGFFEAFAELYPVRPGRRRRVIPAVPDGPEARNILNNAGFRHSAGSVSQTIWVDLAAEEAALFARLRRDARNKVRKAQKAGIVTEWDDRGRTADWLVRHESQARHARGYRGPSAAFLRKLHDAAEQNDGSAVLTGRALLAGRPVAGVMLALHPPAATWLIGWNGDAGRACGAHNMLLWDGYRILKQRGIRYLDLGGANDGPARAVKTFKEGMGGELVTRPGLYR